jgi:cytoskeleton protein RodZ
MESIGERLRQERLRQGFDLQQIAELTKINLVFLEAIEADDLEKLPGIFFTRSFVRQYARALTLDEVDFEPELNRLAACERVPTIERPPVSPAALDVPPMAAAGRRSRRQRPLGSLVVLLLIVAACSVIFVLWQRSREDKPASSGQSASATAPQPAAAADDGLPAAAPTPQPASPAPALSSEPAATSGPATEAAAPETSPPGQTATTQTAPIQVRIHAIEATWVRIAVDGQYVFSGLLRKDETRTVEANQLAQLRTGNAAGIEVSWNGKPVGSLGPAGQVRNVEFTAAGFKVLALPAPERMSPDDGP